AFMLKRGVAVPVVAITALVSANAVQAAPVGLASTVTAAAVVKGITVSASTATLIKGVMKVMTWTKIKTTPILAVALLVAAGPATVAVRGIASPGADDSFWLPLSTANLNKAPAGIIIRNTKFNTNSGYVRSNGRAMFVSTTGDKVIATAYNVDQTRAIF